jgi:ketosteroid isomerase-like protein
MSFDPMAAAIDWLDAFRSGDLESVVEMFADDAVIRCDCSASIADKDGLRLFWEQRLHDCAPSDLDDLQPSGDGVMITYRMREGLVAATLDFDAAGRIVSMQCDTVDLPTANAGLAKAAGT